MPDIKKSIATNKYIDRPFNIRPFCFWSLLVGITIAFCMWSLVAVVFWFIFLILAFLICRFFKFKDKFANFFAISRLFAATAILLCLVVVFSFAITTLTYSHQKSHSGTHDLTGTIETHRFRPIEEGISYFVLSSVMFNNIKVEARVIVFVNDYANERIPSTGDKVSVSTTLRQLRAIDQTDIEKAALNINSRVQYSANTSISDLQITGQNNSVRFAVLRYSKSFLNKYLSLKNADLMASMLFGDRSALDDEIRDNFSVTGLAHVLAVSGLHVGIIIGMLTFLLRLLKLNRKKQFPIIFIVLLFYCYLCDFRFSILRACIMFLVILANRIYLRNTDFLSSICLAAIITLILFPYSILSVSFQLSYACMIGIALFQHPVEKFMNKAIIKRAPNWLERIQRFINKGFTMQCCVMVASFPIILKYFGVFPVFGMIVNILLLPVLILAFQVAILALVTYVAFPLLYLAEYLIKFVLWGTQVLATAPFAQIPISNGGYWLLFYFAALFVMSRFVFMKRKYKYIAGAILLCIYSIGFLV